MTTSAAELQQCLSNLTKKQNDYIEGKGPPQMNMVIVREMSVGGHSWLARDLLATGGGGHLDSIGLHVVWIGEVDFG